MTSYKELNLKRIEALYKRASSLFYGKDVHMGGDDWCQTKDYEAELQAHKIIASLYNEISPYEEEILSDVKSYKEKHPYMSFFDREYRILDCLKTIIQWYEDETQYVLDIEKKTNDLGNMSISKELDTDDATSHCVENESNSIFQLNDKTIIEIHNKCNGEQWENILIDNFIDLLNSNGENQSLIIRNKEINRTKVVFRMIAKSIDKAMLKEWIEGIEKNVFGGVEFMKSTLRTDKLSGGYSDKDVKFKPFIDSL